MTTMTRRCRFSSCASPSSDDDDDAPVSLFESCLAFFEKYENELTHDFALMADLVDLALYGITKAITGAVGY